MRGTPWLPEHTATLEKMAGRPAREIAAVTGHAIATVKKHRELLGLKGYSGRRENWTRRDWLMADAAGLDFQISF